jgi:16S rRNA (cytosine967-C5)-methyltransferase
VLRRIARDVAGFNASAPPGEASLPDWLWRSWSGAYGPEQATAMAAALLAEPPLDFTVKDPQAATHWAQLLHAEVLPGNTLRRAIHQEDQQEDGAGSARIDALPGFAEGAWWIQDFAAGLPVQLLGSITGRRVLDLCAAPGGKTAQLAAGGAEVTAIDRSEDRLRRLRENLARLGLSAETHAADAAGWGGAEGNDGGDFDIVLLDAPCSATGTLRRHPDVAWLKEPRDVAKLAAAQDRLLDAAIRLARPGGTVLYCVCSLQPEEGPDRIEAALARHAGIARQPFSGGEAFGLGELLTPAGDLRTLPCHLATRGGMDGFYAARLFKNG